MKETTKLMIKKYSLMKLKYDFMGYEFNRLSQLSYHHLVVPKRKHGEISFENGAILRQDTSHNYLHLIEHFDYDMFLAITSEMIEQNVMGHLDIENLRHIDDVLSCFEREYANKRNAQGKLIIKEEYQMRLLKK